MDFHFPGYAIAYVVAALLSFITAGMTWRRRINPGSTYFMFLMFSLTVWSFASIFEAGAITVSNKLFWSKWQYIGIATVAPLWLLFITDFTNQKIITKTVRGLIWVIPILTLGFAFTNEYHGLLWPEITILPGPLNIGYYEHGFWFYIHTGYSYSLLLIGTVWLIKSLLKFPKKKRNQIRIIIFTLIIGWTANFLYVSRLLPVSGLDITPLSFTFITLIFSWSMFKSRFFDLLPIARDKLLDNMMDGVIVLDSDDIIIDINPAALRIINNEAGISPLGRSVWDAFQKYGNLIKKFRNKTDFQSELQLSNTPDFYVALSVSTIRDENKEAIGQIITIRDITKRKLIEIKESDQRKLAEALADTAAIINSTLNLDDVLQRILENVGKVVPHDAADIALVDEHGVARFVRIKGYEKYGTQDVVPVIECRVADIPNFCKMAESNKPQINPDTDADPEWNREIPGSAWIKSYMGAPIIRKGQLLGFINLDSATPNFFKPEYLPRLKAFADYTAVAIQNAQFVKEISESANEIAILYEIGLAVTSGLGLDITIKSLFEQLKKVVPIDLFYIAILHPEEDIVWYYMYEGDGTQIDFKPISIKDYPSFTRYVIEKKETVYIPDSHAGNSEFPEGKMIKAPGHDERSILGIPLILRSEVSGGLFLQANPPNAYDQDQILLIETIASQATIAMDNAQLFEKIQNMAITDSLTGIYNRRYFHIIAENEIARSLRYKKDLSLIMIDIDHFKIVNDQYGHLLGDRVLKMVADTCLGVLRKVDVMCRFGGEEFVVLLPETPQKEAIIAAKRICEEIAAAHLSTEKGEISVTVSIGVAQLNPESGSLNDLINSADKALYAAKSAGRNCVKVLKQSGV